MSNLENLKRLYFSKECAIRAINEYNTGKSEENKEVFIVYDLTSNISGDVVNLLKRTNNHSCILPRSEINQFIQKPGEYLLHNEVVLWNQQLDNDSLQITTLKLLVDKNGTLSLRISAIDPPPLLVCFGNKKSLSTVARLEDLGFPKNFSLKKQ